VLRLFCGTFILFDSVELLQLIVVSLKKCCHLITDLIRRRKIVIVCKQYQYCYF
jgi:hypothetical protein